MRKNNLGIGSRCLGIWLKTVAMPTKTSLIEMNSVVKRETNSKEQTDIVHGERRMYHVLRGVAPCAGILHYTDQ